MALRINHISKTQHQKTDTFSHGISAQLNV